jgi:hypothetical protein
MCAKGCSDDIRVQSLPKRYPPHRHSAGLRVKLPLRRNAPPAAYSDRRGWQLLHPSARADYRCELPESRGARDQGQLGARGGAFTIGLFPIWMYRRPSDYSRFIQVDLLQEMEPLKQLRRFAFDHPWERPRSSLYVEADGRTIRSERNGDFRIISVMGTSIAEEMGKRIRESIMASLQPDRVAWLIVWTMSVRRMGYRRCPAQVPRALRSLCEAHAGLGAYPLVVHRGGRLDVDFRTPGRSSWTPHDRLPR